MLLSKALRELPHTRRPILVLYFVFLCKPGGVPSHTSSQGGVRSVTLGLQRALYKLATPRFGGAVVGTVDGRVVVYHNFRNN